MKLVIIAGPPAVGKMTVGQELEKLTGLKLFHNHMSLELVNKFFDFGTPHLTRLDKEIRFSIFREIARSDLPGLIFTMVWAFDMKEDEEYINEMIAVFADRNPEVFIVELSADLDVRLIRNRHPHRLSHKESKNNLEMSERSLLHSEQEYRMFSLEGEFPDKRIFKIDNTHIAPEEVAQMIQREFGL
ncbi:MAG: AAA family ATPase [Bacteroidia bacterium]